MQIANPLYGNVFQYLFEDEVAARLLLSELLGRDIVEISYDVQPFLQPHEPLEITRKTPRFFSLVRLSLRAKVRHIHPDGTARHDDVLIKVQKVASMEVWSDFIDYTELEMPANLPLHPNYLDRYALEHIPICQICFITQSLPARSLVHGIIKAPLPAPYKNRPDTETIIVFTPSLQGIAAFKNAATDALSDDTPPHPFGITPRIQKLLSLFKIADDFKDTHRLIIDDEDYDTAHLPILRRLEKAIETPSIVNAMYSEDDYLHQFTSREEQLFKKVIERAVSRA